MERNALLPATGFAYKPSAYTLIPHRQHVQILSARNVSPLATAAKIGLLFVLIAQHGSPGTSGP
jgi:hypothetical protein